MNEFNLKDMNGAELVSLYSKCAELLFENRRKEKEIYVENNQSQWETVGQVFQHRRELLGLSAAKMCEIVGTSSTTLRKFETGKPVMNSKLIEKSYMNALQLLESDKVKTNKDITQSNDWTHSELSNFYEILWHWIFIDDHTYELYSFLRRESQEVGNCLPFSVEERAKIKELFHHYKNYLDLDISDSSKEYEIQYLEEQKEYEEYQQSKKVS